MVVAETITSLRVRNVTSFIVIILITLKSNFI